jgi:hypothetical protein
MVARINDRYPMFRKTAWLVTGLMTFAGLAAAQEGAAPAAAAADSPVVVELFTSQGCSSCPAADALLAEMEGREDIIPLALHVDYWDYIGWADGFARPEFTRRQKGYAASAGERRIYTPQIIVNGREDVVGSHPMKVAALIEKHAAAEPRVALQVRREGGRLHIHARALEAMRPCAVYVVQYEPAREVMIERGENAGRSIRYTHIVRDWQLLRDWDDGAPFEAVAEVDETLPVVVLVQEDRYGPILAAARLD